MVAGAARATLLSAFDRYGQVTAVLGRVFVLNVAVAAAKIIFGYASGTVSILSDGFHSLTDSASNVVALVGIRMARKPPDEEHPYGHRKYETIASGLIFIFLLVVVVEVVRAAVGRFGGPPPEVTALSFGVMIATATVNVGVVRYERRAGERLSSELLLADAMHTRSDLLTSMAVIAALVGVRAGYWWLDPAAALMVATFIGYAGVEIARHAARILADSVVVAEEDVRQVVMSVPTVLGCHHIRTRGSADHVFLDLHIWFAPETPLRTAHDLSHIVKNRIMHRFPQIVDAIIHIEPPPDDRSEK
ncbi:MAG: cation transporter [Acidobacteria bacterium]|nr:cation transporter [Acidobacteriota bacterium]